MKLWWFLWLAAEEVNSMLSKQLCVNMPVLISHCPFGINKNMTPRPPPSTPNTHLKNHKHEAEEEEEEEEDHS